jgi:hypothetical protein
MGLDNMLKTFVVMEEQDGYKLLMQDYKTNYKNYSMFLLITPKGRILATKEDECEIFREEEVEGKIVQKFVRKGILNDNLELIRQKLNV